ncbi:MAG TPA: YihY/virulence factor BrkB family protein [Polyangiales bacterium]|nr:YihY/virulence factor BrkB family protein [Polyangiales bacterium]
MNELRFGPRLLRTVREIIAHISDDERDLAAAGLAFYMLLSIAPLGVVAIQVAAAFFDPHVVQEALTEDLGRAAGRQVSSMLADLLQTQQDSASATTILSFLVLLWAASRLFHRLQAALNLTWGVRADPTLRTREAIRLMLQKRAISFLMVLGSGAALLVSLVLKSVIALLQTPLRWVIKSDFLLSPGVVQAEETLLSFVLMTSLVAGMFRVLPDVRVAWRDVWVGATLTSILLVLGMGGFSLYVATVGASQLAGAIGSIAVLMLWAYYTSHVLLLGALFTRIWADGPLLREHPISLSASLRDKPEPAPEETGAGSTSQPVS